MSSWRDRPPSDNLESWRFSIGPGEFMISVVLGELKMINEVGDTCIESGDYLDAIWKYENFVVICDKFDIEPKNEILAKVYSNNARAALELLKGHSINPRYMQMYASHVIDRATRCIKLDGTEYRAQALFWRAEAFRLMMGVSSCVNIMTDYVDCFKLAKEVNPRQFLQVLVLAHKWNCTELLSGIQLSSSCLSTVFLQVTEEEKTIAGKCVHFLLNNYATEKRKIQSLFKIAVNLLELCPDLLTAAPSCMQFTKLFWHNNEALMRIVKFLNEKKAFPKAYAIAESVLQSCKVSTAALRSVCTALTPNQRCKLLNNVVTQQEVVKVDVILNSGEIDSKRFKLEDVIKKMTLDSKSAIALMQLLAGNPSIAKSKAIGALNGRWKTTKHPPDQLAIVQMLCLLINANVPVKDLCCFLQRKTTPVHVAIHLCQVTGSMEIIEVVVRKVVAPDSEVTQLDLLDEDGKTPLHFAAAKLKEKRAEACKLLLSDLKIDPTIKDQAGKTAADYLAPGDELHSLLTVIPEITVDKVEPQHDRAQSLSEDKVETQDTAQLSALTDTKEQLESLIETPLSPTVSLDRQLSSEVNRPSDTYKFDALWPKVNQQLTSLFKKPDEYFEQQRSPESQGELSKSNHLQRDQAQHTLEEAANEPDDMKMKNEKVNEASDADVETMKSSDIEAMAGGNEINFEGEDWKIELNEKVKSILRTFPEKLRRIAIGKLQQIASGNWTQKTSKSVSSTYDIYEARLTKASRIIWGINKTFSPELTEEVRGIEALQQKKVRCYSEVIVVHDIVTDHDNIHRSVEVVEKMYCKLSFASGTMKPVSGSTSQGKRMPRLFANGSELQHKDWQLIKDVLKCEQVDTDAKMVQHQSIVKYYSLTTSLAMNLLHGTYDRSDDPFKVSDEEYDIINLPETKPVVLLGRSGTGKTTCCLCRMWAKFKHYWSKTTPDTPVLLSDFKHNSEHLCQIFIAKNSVLCNRMKRRFYDFVASQQATKQHLDFESRKLPKTLNEVDELAYPLFITAREFFIMLDNSLPGKPAYFDMERESVEHSDYAAENKRIIMLLDSDESDFESDDDGEQTATKKMKRKRTEVTASYFKDKIWPKYLASHCKDSKTDPLLIWMEIQSFIKGSAKSLDTNKGFLSERDYIELGKKMAPNFTGDREEVYRIFQRYDHLLKHQDATSHCFDDCDFIHHLHQKVATSDIQKHIPSVHQIYIDEVQDFTQAELSVISKCCCNANGLFLTGDTAQTIIQGVAFRFEDLRSLFHDIMPQNVPEIHKLTVNHRSMKGVIQLATSITDLLTEFFPKSFDPIPDEKSVHEGAVPIFLSSCIPDDFALILKGDTQEIQPIDFGADQAIIVRTEESRKTLPEILSEGIVLTIFESKGLEFNDVILYDFFSDSQLSQEWCAATLYLQNHTDKAKRKPHPQIGTPHPLSEFNESHHKSLSAELKQLYTAITRAKECIWIYESDEDKRRPMLDYWYRRKLVKLRSLDNISADESLNKTLFPRGSSKEQWEERGDGFAATKHWEQARTCYHKAGNKLLEIEATARLIEQSAVDKTHYCNAVATFLVCDRLCHDTRYLFNAAQCLAKAKEYKDAATLLGRLRYFPRAFRLFNRIGDVDGCVRMKELSKDYQGAIAYLLKQHKDVEALQTAKKYLLCKLIQLHSINLPTLTKAAQKYALKCSKSGNDDGVKLAVYCIPDLQDRVGCLKRAHLYSEACDILFETGKHKAAFILLHAQGLVEAGYKFALRMEDTQQMYLFTFQSAMMEIKKFDCIKDCDISERLLEISKCDDDLRKAKALILLCRSLCSNEQKVDTALEYGEAALKVYRELRNTVGEIEAFSLLVKLQLIYKENPLQFVGKALQCATEAQKVVKVLENKKASMLLVKNQMQQFYDLEQRRNSYITAKGQDIWIESLEKDCLTDTKTDSDGFLVLDEALVLKKIVSHFTRYVSTWMANSKVKGTITNKLAVFAFYKEVKNKIYLQRSFPNCTENDIQDFLSACKLALQTDEIGLKLFDTNGLMMNLDRLLKPFSLLYLPLGKKPHFLTLRELPLYKNRVKEIVQDTLSKESETDADMWLQGWQLLSILGEDAASMKAKLGRKSAKVDQEHRLKPAPYEFVNTGGKHSHFFYYWLQSCDRIKVGDKALLAIKLCVNMFIEPIARRRSLHISVENIVSIISVHTTALLAMISCCSHLRMVVPKTFIVMVQNFDELNCQTKTDVHLLEACMKTTQKMDQKRVLEVAYKLLRRFLEILLGIYKRGFNILNYAIKGSFESSEATHCLILVAVIIGNLALAGYKPQDIEKYQTATAKALQPLYYSKHRNSANSHVARLQHAYAAFVSSANTKDLFRSVVCKLSDGFGMPEILELKVFKSLPKAIAIMHHRIPATQLPICKYDHQNMLAPDVVLALRKFIKATKPTSQAVQIKTPDSDSQVGELKQSPTKPKATIIVKHDSNAQMATSGPNSAPLAQIPEHQSQVSDKDPDQNTSTEPNISHQELPGEAEVQSAKKLNPEQTSEEVKGESEATSKPNLATENYKPQHDSASGEDDSKKQLERLESFPGSEAEEPAQQEEDLEVHIDDDEVLQEVINAVTHEEGEHVSSSEESDFEYIDDETIVDKEYCQACDEQFENKDEQKAHIQSAKHKFKSGVFQSYYPIERELKDILDKEDVAYSPETTQLLDKAKGCIESNRVEIERLAKSTEWEVSLAVVRDMGDTISTMMNEITEMSKKDLEAVKLETVQTKSEVDETADDEMSEDDDDFRLQPPQVASVQKKKGNRNERRKKSKQKLGTSGKPKRKR